MNRRLSPTKSTLQIKEKQSKFLLEDVEKNLEEYKKATELKDKKKKYTMVLKKVLILLTKKTKN